jgi:hypothetical protein
MMPNQLQQHTTMMPVAAEWPIRPPIAFQPGAADIDPR